MEMRSARPSRTQTARAATGIFHALRHTTGSWLAANGVRPKVIQEIMRHGDINLTMTRYGHTLRGRVLVQGQLDN